MTDKIINYSDMVVGMQYGDDYVDLTKYLTGFDLGLDYTAEQGVLGGRKTQWAVPTGAMLTAALTGYILQNETPKFSEIFAGTDPGLFMVYAKPTRRATAFRGFVNTDNIIRRGGVQSLDEPLMVRGIYWTGRLSTGNGPKVTNGVVAANSYAFVHLTGPPSDDISLNQGTTLPTVPAFPWGPTVAERIALISLTAGSGQTVEVGADATAPADDADKALVNWGIAQVLE